MGQTNLGCIDRIQAHFNTIQSNDSRQQTDISWHFEQVDNKGRDDVQVHILSALVCVRISRITQNT